MPRNKKDCPENRTALNYFTGGSFLIMVLLTNAYFSIIISE